MCQLFKSVVMNVRSMFLLLFHFSGVNEQSFFPRDNMKILYVMVLSNGFNVKQFFIKKSLEKGLPPFWSYGVALLHLDSLSHTFVELAIRFVKCLHNTKGVLVKCLVNEHTRDGSAGSWVPILASSAPNPL